MRWPFYQCLMYKYQTCINVKIRAHVHVQRMCVHVREQMSECEGEDQGETPSSFEDCPRCLTFALN